MDRCALCDKVGYRFIRKTFDNKEIGKCMTCGFVQVYPHATNKEIASFYDDDWDHFAPYLSQISAHRRYFKKILSLAKTRMQRPIKSLLDIGCAIGVLLDEAKELGIQTRGIDISNGAVSYAKKHHLSVSLDTTESFRKKGRHNQEFDVITALEVIEHEKYPVMMVRNIYAMLRPGGIVILTTPNFHTVFRTLMGDLWVGYQHREHLWFFTPDTMKKLLQKAGFSDIRIQQDFFRAYSISFMFQRLGDYISFLRPVTRICASLTKGITVTVPFNPWGDMQVVAKK